MPRSIQLTLLITLIAAVLIAWQASVAHLYNPTIRTPVPQPRVQDLTSAEIAARIHGIPR